MMLEDQYENEEKLSTADYIAAILGSVALVALSFIFVVVMFSL